MKYQYESEILFRLMERDGFNIPSSVPPYEAEIKAYLIEQVKLAYPKLNDYEAEWLLYNYTKHLPAEFPISSVSNVTKASFENVVPFAYQSAILKGNTLVNVATKYHGGSDENGEVLMSPTLLKANTKYYIKVIDNEFNLKSASFRTKDWIDRWYPATNGVAILTTPSQDEFNNYKYLVFNVIKNGEMVEIDNTIRDRLKWIICEYQEGMENWDIPYFEGMQSVTMPVLTTVGKNLFDKTKIIFDKTINFNTGDITDATATNITDFIKVIPNTQYTMSFNFTTNVWTRCYGLTEPKHGKYITDANGASDKCYFDTNWNRMTFTTSPTTHYLIFSFGKGVEESFQLEQRSTSTSYEPYKTNILTANEEVELHGIGDAQDTLDCLTGEVIKRIDEVVLDGSSDENWFLAVEDGYTYKRFRTECLSNKKLFINREVCNIICDKVPCYPNSTWKDDREGIDHDAFHITFRKNCETLAEFRQYLSKNPITIRYQRKTESIKTVDLKTVNESGESVSFMPLEGTMNVSCSSETIQPTFDMSVPVEATTQNLASFIDLEMEE